MLNFVGHFMCCFYVVIAEMLSMDPDDMFDKPWHTVRRSQERCGGFS